MDEPKKISELTAITTFPSDGKMPLASSGVTYYIDKSTLQTQLLGYKVYSALISQRRTSAPTQTGLIANTLGEILFAYNGVGDYNIVSAGLFTSADKFSYTASPSNGYQITLRWVDVNTVSLSVMSNSGTSQNEILNLTPIQIFIGN